MIDQAQMHHAIDESYDALALIQVAARALEEIQFKLQPPYNNAMSDVRRVLLVCYKKSEVAHDALEFIDLEGFAFEGDKCHV